jgi:HEAT repeat protein
LEFATQDPHHRVAINALVGLFQQGDASAIERLSNHARHGSPAFRIAAAWALGLTGKPEAWPALNALRDDPVPHVRESALRALEKVPAPQHSQEAQPGDPQVPPPERPQETADQPDDEAAASLLSPQFRLVS